MNAAKQAAQSATASKHLQEQLLSAGVEKFRVDFATNFAVIQQQNYLAQAETTEIAASAAWKKASIQLDWTLGSTLQRNGTEVNVSRYSTVQTIDFLLSAKRDATAAKRFFEKVFSSPSNPIPRVINVDKERSLSGRSGCLESRTLPR